ncbi:DHA2 family efflux MFS transporter permease subunit [Actinoplanes sp. TBRC 11911]|uniref:DHA2 family efflux MFS transporter permease subunit n=1 Tax=Actinoplanes sp. TBRC 11911 TaxID=2729386 RepID=UPI00145ED576|nr:DHA2 family efflux MFS transporter permease subunit [Actinoplanes sp. TBRC 11911]NMO50081.1 DHA2 family efflux MFS transporter permease subunit [Actinoplanes sp. TBRC 11911]
MSTTASAPAVNRTSAPDRPWLIFTLVGIAQFMVVLDIAIINVAIPVMKAYLRTSDSSIQWVVTAYVLAFGGCLLLGGRAGDFYGRRRVLVTGMIAFTVFSLLIAISTSLPEMIIFRGLQGLSAALMAPSALSIVIVTFPEARQRGKALGYWSLIATGGAAVGLLLGGVLTQYAGWRWNFLINVPVGVVISILVTRLVPAHAPQHRSRSLDIPGAALVTVGLMGVVFGFSEAPERGWGSAATIGALAGAVLALSAFVLRESRVAQPLIDLTMFRFRNLTGANLIMACVYGGNLGAFFVLTLWMQDIQGWSAIQTGLAFAPLPVILGGISTRMGELIHRFGPRPFLIAGPSLVVLGMVWLCFLPVHGSYVRSVLPSLLIMGVGYGMTFAPTYAAATAGLAPHQAGAASGLITTAQQVGGAVGLAILAGVAASVTAGHRHPETAAAITTGYDAGMVVAAALTLVAVVIAATVIRRR